MSLRTLTQQRWLLSTLLIAGAALFTVGVAAERHATDHHTESGTEATSSPAHATQPPSTTAGGDADGGETTQTSTATGGSDGGEATTHTEAPGGEATGQSETSGETVFGVNLESNGPVAVAIIISLGLAILTWMHNRRSLLLVTLAFALMFAVFDIAEITHQIKESRAGLAVLAASIAVVHLMTAAVARQRATTD